VAAFEQSLSNMTQRLQKLSSTSQQKDSELNELRVTIESLRLQGRLPPYGGGGGDSTTCTDVNAGGNSSTTVQMSSGIMRVLTASSSEYIFKVYIPGGVIY